MAHQRFTIPGAARRAGPLPQLCIERPATVLFSALAAASFVFMAAPGIDLAASRIFTDAAGAFHFDANPALLALRDLNRLLLPLAVGLLLAILAMHAARPEEGCSVPAHRVLFVLSVIASSGGILVPLLKAVTGRARPDAVAPFGGEAPFSAAWQLSGACARNCSFPSGEAASGASLLALIALLPARARVPALLVGVPFAMAVSLNRVAFGRHFLSDVVVAWLVTALAALLLHRFFAAHGRRIDAGVRGSAQRVRRRARRRVPRPEIAGLLFPRSPARL
ncbi:phosphatase PAP2 family protein [Antarcticirhabdus aurantiaca]|uniref:Phosphatase PAP2 family protein n=1 Tax=Antarcticirhabdus aurantiaca TaxID=2606717 RepID=A0ACD4NLY1_9HYPH|nr:phosphatase PAP2 family protein [Antarcticirhabdus aurantiaca]WAJ27676.1 phosphatase PAP2 family protein [Jeongeuplla avenae]